MTITIGSGDHTYSPEENWAKLPDGWEFGDVAAVGVDRWDRVYCFNRGPHPMVVSGPRGQFPEVLGRGHLPSCPWRAYGTR